MGCNPNGVIIRELGHFEFKVLVGHPGGNGDIALKLKMTSELMLFIRSLLACELHGADGDHLEREVIALLWSQG